LVFSTKKFNFFAEDATTRRRGKAKRARAGRRRDPDYEEKKPKLTFRNVARLSIFQENCSKEKKMQFFFFSLLLEKFLTLLHNTALQRQFCLYCIFLFWEWRGLSPNFHIHVSVSDLYIPRISLHMSSSRTGRPIVGIYNSLTDT